MVVIEKPWPTWVLWGASTIWPLGGFFNIFIYTRPKVTATRRAHPEVYSHRSWLVVFLVVIFSGGEVPTDINHVELNENETGAGGSEQQMMVPVPVYANISNQAENGSWTPPSREMKASLKFGWRE